MADGSSLPASATGQATGRPRQWIREHETLGRRLGLGGLFVAMAVVMTFPNVSRLNSHTAGDYNDPFFYQWLLRWDVHALTTSLLHLFDANIFYPARQTLLYADTLLPVAPVAGAMQWMFGPVLGFNLMYLATWVLSLVTTYTLARWLTDNTLASVLAAIVFTFAAAHLSQYFHLQLLFVFLVPLAVWLLLRFLEERRWWQALTLGLTVGTMTLIAVYYALIIGLTLGVIAGGWLVAERFKAGPRFATGLLLAGATALVMSGPIGWKYQSQADFLRRDYQAHYAAHPGDLLAPGIGSYLYRPVDRWAGRGQRNHEHRLFPGMLALGLGGVGLCCLARSWSARRRGVEGNDEHPRRQRAVVLLLLAGVPPFLLAFGKAQTIAGIRIPMPYGVLTRLKVPGFEAVRALGRFTIVLVLGLAVLAAWGFVQLFARRGRRTMFVAGVVIGGLMLAEYAMPIPMVRRTDETRFTAVNSALSHLPRGPVVEVPMGDYRGSPAWPFLEPPRMVWSSIDWNPRVNGISAYTPPDYWTTVTLMNGLGQGGPVELQALVKLAQLHVRYVVIRTATIDPRIRVPGETEWDESRVARVAAALQPLGVAMVSRHGAAVLIELRR